MGTIWRPSSWCVDRGRENIATLPKKSDFTPAALKAAQETTDYPPLARKARPISSYLSDCECGDNRDVRRERASCPRQFC